MDQVGFAYLKTGYVGGLAFSWGAALSVWTGKNKLSSSVARIFIIFVSLASPVGYSELHWFIPAEDF